MAKGEGRGERQENMNGVQKSSSGERKEESSGRFTDACFWR